MTEPSPKDHPACVTRGQAYAASAAAAAAVFRPTQRDLPTKVAIACRVLAIAGHNANLGLASQVSARDGDAHLWTQTYGLAIEEARPENQIKVDFDLRVVAGQGMANPANRFHAFIYRRRPDIGAIVHTHAPASSTLAMIGRPLEISHMDTMPLYRRVAYLGQWPGVPFGDDEGELIGTALGDHKALLLAHHGMITTGSSVEEACLLAMVFEQAARMQLSALATGQDIRSVQPELGLDARAHADMPLYALAHFEYYARVVARAHGEFAQ